MRYSIITVNLNNKDGLRKTIESVINQNFNDFEYIIIDGGSTDGSVDVIKEYEEKITHWVSEQDKGIYNAMNKGICKAQGDFLNFMNSGDYFVNNNILTLIDSYSISEHIAIIYGDAIHSCLRDGEVHIKPTPFFEFKLALPAKGICHQSSFVKRTWAIKYKFNETFKISADFKMFLDIYNAGGEFFYIPSIISVFDAEFGLSTKKRKLVFKEDAIVSGNYLTLKYCYLYFMKFYFYPKRWSVLSRIEKLLKFIQYKL